jgi:hypothetical protein
MPGPRRFPPPWTVEYKNDACFIVKDKNGFVPAYCPKAADLRMLIS